MNWALNGELLLTYQNLDLEATVCVVLSSANPGFSKLTKDHHNTNVIACN